MSDSKVDALRDLVLVGHSSAGVEDKCCILSDEVVEELFEMILNARRAKGQKEIDGAVRAANIARLIVAGYNNLGICQDTD
jgi:hypothetical protein